MLKTINFKATEKERAALKKDAHRHEMVVSEYIRWLIAKQREEDMKGKE